MLIVINADPDSIASAMAAKRLLWRKVAAVTIASINTVKRSDNIAMINLLGGSHVHIKNIDIARYDRFIIVDSQPDHHPRFSGFTPNVIIDHHPETSCDADFNDIRPDYGAVATIMTEYLKAAGIKPSIKLATALFYAIKTDTDNFIRKTTMKDVRAFQFLYPFTSTQLLQRIETTEISPDFLKYYEKAFKIKRWRKRRMFVHLGKVKSPDACVLIADFFMKVKNVEWSIVSGIYHKKLIIIFRNLGIQKNAGKTANAAFGDLGPSGGHKNMARSELDLKAVGNETGLADDDKLLDWIIRRVESPGKGRGKKNNKKNPN